MPPPSTRDGPTDPFVDAYYAAIEGKKSTWLGRFIASTPRPRRRFDHLLLHSDAEGYYLPIDFAEVVFPPAELDEVVVGPVGSAPRLLRELDAIATALEIPATLQPDSDELSEASDTPAPDGERWRRYGRESFGCVMLREGSRRAIAARAALVFC